MLGHTRIRNVPLRYLYLALVILSVAFIARYSAVPGTAFADDSEKKEAVEEDVQGTGYNSKATLGEWGACTDAKQNAHKEAASRGKIVRESYSECECKDMGLNIVTCTVRGHVSVLPD